MFTAKKPIQRKAGETFIENNLRLANYIGYIIRLEALDVTNSNLSNRILCVSKNSYLVQVKSYQIEAYSTHNEHEYKRKAFKVHVLQSMSDPIQEGLRVKYPSLIRELEQTSDYKLRW